MSAVPGTVPTSYLCTRTLVSYALSFRLHHSNRYGKRKAENFRLWARLLWEGGDVLQWKHLPGSFPLYAGEPAHVLTLLERRLVSEHREAWYSTRAQALFSKTHTLVCFPMSMSSSNTPVSTSLLDDTMTGERPDPTQVVADISQLSSDFEESDVMLEPFSPSLLEELSPSSMLEGTCGVYLLKNKKGEDIGVFKVRFSLSLLCAW
eukprot:2333999-Rhodomonas_salina.1